MSEDLWQPISSAPKDGTKVLLYNSAWDWPEMVGLYDPGHEGAAAAWHGYDGCYRDTDDERPTHWRALPAPPQEKVDD